jgi:hypothetical protein
MLPPNPKYFQKARMKGARRFLRQKVYKPLEKGASMNVPRGQLPSGSRNGNTDNAYREMSVTIYSNVHLSESELFKKTVEKVISRLGLTVDKDLLNKYIDQRIASGNMLTSGKGEAISDPGDPHSLSNKKNSAKGYVVGVPADFQKVIADFSKAPQQTIDEAQRQKDAAEKAAEKGSQTGDATGVGNTSKDSGTPSSQRTPDAPGKTPPGAPVNPSDPNYDVPPGKTLSDVASGRASQPIDVTFSKLASSVYDDNKYGAPPEGWRAIDNNDIAKRLGVSPDDPKVSDWFRQFMGGKYALEGDQTKQQEFKAQIYTDDKGNFVLAYRGTAEGLPDWYDNNVKQAVGLPTDGTNDKFSGTAVTTAQEFARIFGQLDASGKPVNLVLVGHSQGGGLASIGSVATGLPAVTFDASGIHPNTLARINKTPEEARTFAENGGIRAYSLEGDALTKLQESKSILGTIAPDALGTKIQLRPAKGKEGRLMEEYGEPEIGGSKIMRKTIDNAKLPIFVGTLPLFPIVNPVDAAKLPDSLISHSPKALTDALIDHKPWVPKPIPTPRPTPTPTPTPSLESTPEKATTKVGPIPQPLPTPTPKNNPEPDNPQQSAFRSSDNPENSPVNVAAAAGRLTSNTTNDAEKVAVYAQGNGIAGNVDGKQAFANKDQQPLLDDATHPRNGMLRQVLDPIRTRDAELGRGSDDTSLQLAAGMTADARARGLETIAFAQFSPDGRQFYMADTSDPSSPLARTAVGDVGLGLQQSISDSTQRIAQLDQAQAIAQQRSQPAERQAMNQDAPVFQGPKLA